MKCIPNELWNQRYDGIPVWNFHRIEDKIKGYIGEMNDDELSSKPENCDYSRFCLILGQFRHWHRHMGIIYGFIVADTGQWPYVLNMEGMYPEKPMPNFY